MIIIIFIIFIALSFWNGQLASVSQEKAEKKIIIAKGQSVKEIARKLKQENLIRSEFTFGLYTRFKGLSSKLSAGTFNLSPAMSTPEIIKILSGKPSEVWVTLIEGWRIEEMADKLSEQGLVDREKFVKQAKKDEGYLFPDTYLFPNDVTEQQIIKRLRDTFDERFSDELRAQIKAKGLTEDEGVILASIVEREARSEQVRTEIASILLKRFKIDMGLNADATLQYPLGYQEKEKSWWKRHLSSADKKIDSPYNTYLYRGLPPAPICNPGLSSLTAVANANSSTPYLYYYHDSKGNSHYAKTLEEHNQNVVSNP